MPNKDGTGPNRKGKCRNGLNPCSSQKKKEIKNDINDITKNIGNYGKRNNGSNKGRNYEIS